MLIEYLPKGPVAPIYRSGKVFTFKPDPEYDNAVLCDISDPMIAAEFLKSKDKDGKQVCRRFPLAAIRDPEFVRSIQRNPFAALTVLEDFVHKVKNKDLKDLEVDERGINAEVMHMRLDSLRTLAAELGLRFYAQTTEATLIGFVLSHCRNEFARLRVRFEQELEKAKPAKKSKLTFAMAEDK